MANFSQSSECRELVKTLSNQGWSVEKTAKNHFRFIPPDKTKDIVIQSGTSSDHRSYTKLVSYLRRSGAAL